MYNKFLSVNKAIQSSEDYIDSSLSEDGVFQAKELRKVLQSLEIKYVFCSPLNRCLETTLISLETHPKKDSITVLVYPDITEVINGAQDIPFDIPKKKDKYNANSAVKFDWTYFDLLFPAPSGDYYYLHFVDNLDDSLELKNILTLLTSLEDGHAHKEGVYSRFLEYFLTRNRRPESLDHLFRRSVSFKNFLKQFKASLDSSRMKTFAQIENKSNQTHIHSDYQFQENSIIEKMEKEEKKEQSDKIEDSGKFVEKLQTESNNEKILVITHSAFIRMSTTEMAFKMEKVDNYPEDCYRPNNCEVISVNM